MWRKIGAVGKDEREEMAGNVSKNRARSGHTALGVVCWSLLIDVY